MVEEHIVIIKQLKGNWDLKYMQFIHMKNVFLLGLEG